MDTTAVMEPQSPPAATHSLRWSTRMALVLGLAALLFFARLSERAIWSEEVRWAAIPREMQQHGNFLWPTINGRTYYDKPLGSYWLVLLASLFTEGVNETSARLPSAVNGLLAVALAMLIARRLYDDDTAVWTGVILATSFSFVFFARNASTDVETIAGVLAALWIFLRNETKPAGWWTLLLWLVMALTSLTKGLLGFVLPIMIIGLYSTLAPPLPRVALRSIKEIFTRNGWFFNRWSLAAIPFAAIVYLGPFALSIAAGGSTEGLAMVYRENLRRFFDPVNHRGPIYLYTYVIFMLMAPWSVLLPAALAQAHTSADKQTRGRAFALAYFWGTFIFFTLSSSRRSYYLLPILPAGAFLIARLLAGRETLGRAAYILLLTVFLLMSLAVLLSVAALVPASWFLPSPWDGLPELPCPWAFVSAWVSSMVGLGFAWLKPGPQRIAWSMTIIASSFMAYLYLFALPATEVYRTQKPFADAVQQAIDAKHERLALYRTREIFYYLNPRTPIAEYHTPETLEHGVSDQRVRWTIMRRRDWDGLNLKGHVRIEETIHPWESGDAAENKLVLVEFAK